MTPRAARRAARRPDSGPAATHPAVDEEAEVERLRRRLYRPGAGAEDVRRYELARDAMRPTAQDRAPGRPAGASLRPALVAGAAVLVLASAAVLVRTQAAGTASPPERSAGAPTRALVRTDEDRAGMTIRTPSERTEFHGRGAATAWLGDAARTGTDCRLDLRLTLTGTTEVRWSVTRTQVGPYAVGTVRILAEPAGTGVSGVPERIAFPCVGTPPAAVRMEVPEGVAWSLLVASAE